MTSLGVVLDRNLTMAYQVSVVVNAMVTGNLDYCNSLLHGITAGQLGRLQKIQNTAARLILKRNRRTSATMMPHNLHWLPFKNVLYINLF